MIKILRQDSKTPNDLKLKHSFHWVLMATFTMIGITLPKYPSLMYLHFQKSIPHGILNTSLNGVAVKLRIHGRHSMLSYLSSLPIAILRSLGTEAYRFYDRNQLTALLTRCYTQHALRPFIDFESNHI